MVEDHLYPWNEVIVVSAAPNAPGIRGGVGGGVEATHLCND